MGRNRGAKAAKGEAKETRSRIQRGHGETRMGPVRSANPNVEHHLRGKLTKCPAVNGLRENAALVRNVVGFTPLQMYLHEKGIFSYSYSSETNDIILENILNQPLQA